MKKNDQEYITELVLYDLAFTIFKDPRQTKKNYELGVKECINCKTQLECQNNFSETHELGKKSEWKEYFSKLKKYASKYGCSMWKNMLSRYGDIPKQLK